MEVSYFKFQLRAEYCTLSTVSADIGLIFGVMISLSSFCGIEILISCHIHIKLAMCSLYIIIHKLFSHKLLMESTTSTGSNFTNIYMYYNSFESFSVKFKKDIASQSGD